MPNRFWIAVDWGTSNLRAWRMEEHRVTTEAQSGDGMGSLRPDEFEPALLRLIDPWIQGQEQVQIVACGMVGARQGWVEAPYATVPAIPVDPASAIQVPVLDTRLDVRVLPGLCQTDPPDVMRGEETQIAGLLLDEPGFSGLVCLPGTHSKWVQLRGGFVERFQTFMTGELFDLFSEKSVLRHSAGGDAWDEGSFEEGVRTTRIDPGKLAESLFAVRARGLLEDVVPGAARARLSGLLIGAELGWLEQGAPVDRVVVIGEEPVAHLYGEALRLAGIDSLQVPIETTTLKGLCAARDALKERHQ